MAGAYLPSRSQGKYLEVRTVAALLDQSIAASEHKSYAFLACAPPPGSMPYPPDWKGTLPPPQPESPDALSEAPSAQEQLDADCRETHWTDKKTYHYLLTCSMNGCNEQLKTNPSIGDDLNIQAFVRARGWYLPYRKKRKWKVVLCPFHRAQWEEEDFREEMKQSQASVA